MRAVTDSSARARRERRAGLAALLVVAFLVLFMLGYGYLMFHMVGDRPRTWQYKSEPQIPAESYVSTSPAPVSAEPPEQVELPPPTVGKKAK